MPNQAYSIYLASQSPRRRELLRQIGVSHQVIEVAVPEIPRYAEPPSAYVQRLALEKAQAGLAAVKEAKFTIKPLLGADTIVVIGDEILEKPRNQEHGALMLGKLSGTAHQVMTAVAMMDDKHCNVRLSVTDVIFRPLTDEEIFAYWRTGEPHDKAGGYAIQGLGAVFVQQLRGSYTGVVGLPIEETLPLLSEFNVAWWQNKH